MHAIKKKKEVLLHLLKKSNYILTLFIFHEYRVSEFSIIDKFAKKNIGGVLKYVVYDERVYFCFTF